MSEAKLPESSQSPVPVHPLVEAIFHKMEDIFNRLDSYQYLRSEDIQDFLWYSQFFRDALLDIDWRIRRGDLTLLGDPLAPAGSSRSAGTGVGPREMHVALFIGSFDPFQMTHLAMALRYLASPKAEAPLVYIIPEGHENPYKPAKSAYDYRYSLLRMQIDEVFRRLIMPLDIGEGADTMEIVRRYIASQPGMRLKVTHLIGSDVLPFAVRMLPDDFKLWKREAALHGGEIDYNIFILKRASCPPVAESLLALERLKVPYVLDNRELVTPSSTDFRKNNAFSIVFPTTEIIHHLEVLFRYRLNRNWNNESDTGI